MSEDPVNDILKREAQQKSQKAQDEKVNARYWKAVKAWAIDRNNALIAQFLRLADQQGLRPEEHRFNEQGWYLKHQERRWQTHTGGCGVADPGHWVDVMEEESIFLTASGRVIESSYSSDTRSEPISHTDLRPDTDTLPELIAHLVQRINMRWTNEGMASIPPKPSLSAIKLGVMINTAMQSRGVIPPDHR